MSTLTALHTAVLIQDLHHCLYMHHMLKVLGSILMFPQVQAVCDD